MNNKKILAGIEPYNDILYKYDCFYNCLFPTVKYFGLDIRNFLLQDIGVYTLNKSKLDIQYKPISTKTLQLDLNELGVGFMWKEKSEHLISDIKAAIDNLMPVIICVDCFYEPFRKDTYQKKHWPHFLLVYGYDEQLEVMNIIEHQQVDNLSYQMETIGYNDLLSCYEGFLRNFEDASSRIPTFMSFSKDEQHSACATLYQNHYANCISENKLSLLQSLESLKAFTSILKSKAIEKAIDEAEIKDILTGLNRIVNEKQVQCYIVKNIFDDSSELYSMITDILNKWSLFRAVIVKQLFLGSFKEDALTNAFNSLDDIHQLEYKYIRKAVSINVGSK